jgi:hypothetical protein
LDGAERGAIGTAESTDFGISVRHVDRLLDGLLLATSPRVDWAKLLRRTYATDVLACAYCGGSSGLTFQNRFGLPFFPLSLIERVFRIAETPRRM